eukprot:gnl/TRDRNA2_/TRDRNA2_150986_c0_seq2.p1 gnl/TRDRNA2_/TRDRNA2_150986_c0~~gnl/TRDRNA2_/TRDRNA2_150986_c0_seq2.p1  ORF type:complete len:377 (-),score=55.87 gnl/TRDRNA2_/TRDRNA2_150986_c0_seq2:234-1280(-)
MAHVVGHFEVEYAAYAGFASLLGFLLVFRTSQSYSRYWEGCTLTTQMMGDWFGAASALVAFTCGPKTDKSSVDKLRYMIVHLFATLFAIALAELQKVDSSEEIHAEAHVTGLDALSINYLKKAEWKVELVVHWIQRIIIANVETKALTIPPPILSRSFQELSNGMVKYYDCKKISEMDFPAPILSRSFQELSNGMVKYYDCKKISEMDFPAPYDSAMELLQWMHWLVSPWVICHWTKTPTMAGFLTFMQVFIVWTLSEIASELEHPFGTDDDDVDAYAITAEMNSRLMMLLKPEANHLPEPAAHTSLNQARSEPLDISLERIHEEGNVSQDSEDECQSTKGLLCKSRS